MLKYICYAALCMALLTGTALAGPKDGKPLTAPLPSACSIDPCADNCATSSDKKLPLDQMMCCGNIQISSHADRCNLKKLPRDAVCTRGLCLSSAIRDNALGKGKGMISGAKVRGIKKTPISMSGPTVAVTS